MITKLLFFSIFMPFIVSLFFLQEPENSYWKIKIAPENEPGERMIVNGTVYDEDGKTPLAGVELFVYHTDVNGIYGENNQFRLKGTIVTNKDGKYEYNTIKPGSYPGGNAPAHVHYKITGKNISGLGFVVLRFKGDPYLTAKETKTELVKKNFSQIQELKKGSDGILRCTMDIRVKRN